MITSTTSVAAGEVMFEAFAQLGVTHVFGMPGSQTVPLFEALRRSRLTAVVPTHELAASFMAGAFYRVAGRPAVLITIPGPGFAYALTGLAESRLDSAALIHVVPSVEEGPDARFALQAIPQTKLAANLAKATLEAGSVADLSPVVRQAHELATSGEPGPVVVQLGEPSSSAVRAGHPLEIGVERDSLDNGAQLAERIAGARRPVIFAGQGCLGAARELRDLAVQMGAPVLTTTSARGLVPEDHRLAMAFDTHRGTDAAVNALLNAADLVVVMGAHLGHNGTSGHRIKFDPARTIHVDADRAALGRVCARDACASMPVEEFLGQLTELRLQRSTWSETEVSAAKLAISQPCVRAAEPLIGGLAAAEFFASLRRALPRNCVMVTDTGLHQVLVRRHMPVLEPRGLLIPSDFQSMGFGLPAAIAAKLAAPQRPVIALIGDGGLAMSGMELATAAGLGITLPVMVFDDGKLNQIRLHQQAAFGSAFGTDLPRLDFEALAAATGVCFADAGSDLSSALAAALEAGGPTLMRVPVNDSQAVRRVRAVARGKALLRRGIGDRLIARLRGRK